MLPQPVSFSDRQLDDLRNLASPLPQWRRAEFLRAVADEVRRHMHPDTGIGDGDGAVAAIARRGIRPGF
jgi:hypothetical protein